ncbi:MAG TPA: hypothetical protein VM687_09495 [Stenotrophomonas sp.]|nr:hypothetical protein [Stenotrophomonas sp.]
MTTSRKLAVLVTGLAGSALLAHPALAMTELPSGYGNAPPTASATPPPTAETPPPAEQASADTAHDPAKHTQGAATPEQKPATNGGSTPRADKGMEGKCGEGKCGSGG